MLLTVAKQSLLSRKKTALLTFLSLTISIFVLFAVEHIRLEAKNSFNRSVSGTDLIVGAPSGQLNLLLYSIFRLGNPTNNIQYASYQVLRDSPLVEWAIPISLGDSHKGFRVLGTSTDFFEHYQYGGGKSISIEQGERFVSLFDTVIGADVADRLGYAVGDKIIVAHGIGSTSFAHHDQAPFTVVGIIARTGTPLDKTVHVSLEAIEAIHQAPTMLKQLAANPESAALQPESVTAVMLGLKSRLATFNLQRDINNYSKDRLMAVLPGVAMTELWSLVGIIEDILRVIAILVMLSALFGLSTMLLASMNERRGEIAVLRILGAGPSKIMFLVLLEAVLITLGSLVLAVSILTAGLITLEGWLASQFSLFLSWNVFSIELMVVSVGILAASVITAAFPCYEAYKTALHQQVIAAN